MTKDVAVGLEEGKTPLKPVSLLKKGWSCCILICQSENNAKELKSYVLVCCGVNLITALACQKVQLG